MCTQNLCFEHFSYFCSKRRLWVCVPTIYVLSKNKKNSKNFLLKIFIFYNLQNLCILHGQVFVMKNRFTFIINLCLQGLPLVKTRQLRWIIMHECFNLFNFAAQTWWLYRAGASHLSPLVGKPIMWFPNRSDTNQAVQS